MFATLLGGLPRPPLDARAPLVEVVAAVLEAQQAAGLEPLTDGGFGTGRVVDDWTMAAGLTSALVKAVVIGPYTAAGTDGAGVSVLEHAAQGNAVLRELAAAGCPLIEVHEPAAVGIGEDPEARALFREAHLRLLDGVAGTHPSLAVTGGAADGAGVETLLAAPYASLAVDLIAGPDNWRLVVATPTEVGIVCGVLSATPGGDESPEVLLWAAGYAASTGGRGMDRVGLATASSLARLSWPAAIGKMEALRRGVALASLPADERRRAMDPRAVDARSAALGRYDPPKSR